METAYNSVVNLELLDIFLALEEMLRVSPGTQLHVQPQILVHECFSIYGTNLPHGPITSAILDFPPSGSLIKSSEIFLS